MFYLHAPSVARRFVVIVCAVGLALFATAASAQRYAVMQPKLKEGEGKLARSAVTNILRNSQSLNEAQRNQVATFFNGYYFPKMTKTDPESLGELAELRQDFFQQYLNFTTSKQVRNDMVALSLTSMARIALGNFHPAARYNAILLIGMLDEEPAKIGANAVNPTPLPAATNALIMVLTLDEIKDVKVPISAKVGALVGLERHARFGIDQQYAEPVTEAALALIAQQEPPEDVSKAVHHWMKCQAARVLVNQFQAGPTADVHAALVALVADEDMSLDDRCSAAQLLRKMKYEGAANLDVADATLKLGELAVTVLTKESKVANDFLDELSGSAGSFSPSRSRGISGYGGMGGRGNVDTGPHLEKRRMLARTDAIADAARALGQVSDEAKAKVDELRLPIEEWVDQSSNKNAIDVNVARAVLRLADDASQIVAAWRPAEDQPAEEPAPEDVFE